MAEDAPLADLRVVERASGLAASYAGFLLAALGAEVVKVEPPGAARTVPGASVVERGKRPATLDPARTADVACWGALVAGADAVLGDESAPEVPATPGLVRCRVSAWGGASDLPPDEALVAAASGVHAMQWSWSRRPVWLVTPVVAYMTGMLAALGVAAAVFARRRGAPGQAVRVSGLRAAFALNSGTYVTGPETRGSLSPFRDPGGGALGLVVPLEDPRLGPTWQPGELALFSDTPAPRPPPAREPGADTTAVRAAAPEWRRPACLPDGPPPRACLAGIHVLDLASFIAGPFCPMLLADLGAGVLKFESAAGEPSRIEGSGSIGRNLTKC